MGDAMPEEERAAGSGVQEPASLSSGPEEEPSRVGGAVEGEGNPASAPLAGESRVADGPASRMRASRHALKACQLSAEIQAVLAVMRQSGSKWSQNVPALVEETVPEDPLVYDLKTLRKDVLTWTPEQWDSLPPITYLAPFLHVISTAKTNTVVTAVALSSLQKILSLDYFDERSYGAAEAMHQIVAALTSCHFEIVDAASEEAVLLRILQVLVTCIKCQARSLLSDREVCLMVNTCFRVLNQPGQLSSVASDVLQRAACQALSEMIREIFSQLPSLPPTLGTDLVRGEGVEGTLTPLASTRAEEDEAQSGVHGAKGGSEAEGVVPGSGGEPAAGSSTEGRGEGEEGPQTSPAAAAQDGAVAAQGQAGQGAPGPGGPRAKEQALEEAVAEAADEGSLLGRAESGLGDEDGFLEGRSNGEAGASGRPHGTACMVEILLFLCALLDPDFIAAQQQGRQQAMVGFLSFTEKDEEETPLLPLSLVSAALELAGSALGDHPKLLVLVQDNLFRALLYHGLSPNVLVLSQVLSLVYCLHQTLRAQLKLQLESFVSCVLLRLALGPKHGGSFVQQELALEALCDFATQPAFATELYANYDCEITCGNTFEELATMLSRTAIPVNSPLTTINVLALEALLNILSGLSRRLQPGSPPPPAQLPAEAELAGDSFWTSVPEDVSQPGAWVEFVQRKKFIKRRLLIGADHFNRDPKKGLQFLQGIGLFPTPLEPRSVACFFRYTPGLSKLLMGDYLGDHDTFKVQVLQEFVRLFDFQSMTLDAALRAFLESFRLPGEAQKIARVLEAFAEHYYGHYPGVLANKDTAYVLAYSLIMLNTDQHNGQVKKKMTEEEFIRNNRKINDGKDLPRDMLSELYHSIAKNEIKITADAASRAYHEMTYSLWMDILRRSSTAMPYMDCASCPSLDREVFVLIASPSIAAISVVFDNTEEEVLLRKCAEGFLCLASLCAGYGLGDLLDNLVVSIGKFISLLNPGALPDEPAITFGEDLKARLAAVTLFGIANRHGDMVRAAWRNVLDCVLRLHKLGLLPGKVIAEVEDMPGSGGAEGAEGGASVGRSPSALPVSTLAMTSPHILGRKKQAGGLISRMSQLFLLDSEDGKAGPTQQQAVAQQKAVSTIAECRVGDLFTGSQHLQPASLQQLANALVWAAGRPLRGGGAGSLEDEDTAVFCLDLLFVVTIANGARAILLWPLVSDCLSAIVQAASGPNPLVERAVIGVLRVCQKVVPQAGEAATDEILRSLQLILSLDARAAEAYCLRITRELKGLVCDPACLGEMRTSGPWRSVCRLLGGSSHHVEAWEPGFEALAFIMGEGGAHVTPISYNACMDAARDFAEARTGGLETSKKALDLLGGLVSCLERWREGCTAEAAPEGGADGQGGKEGPADASKGKGPGEKGPGEKGGGREKGPLTVAQVADMWLRLAQVVKRVCLDPREEVRTYAVFWLQRCLLAGEALRLPVTVWTPCFDQLIFVLATDLIEAAARPKEYRGIEATLLAGMKLLARVFLHFLPALSSLPGPSFRALWFGVLGQIERALKAGKRLGGEQMLENGTELMKNLLVVMQARGVLVNNPDDPDSIWDQTWKTVKVMLPRLRPESIEEMVRAQEPREPPPSS